MKLTTIDRLAFAVLYPKESNLITQVLIKDIDDKVKLTQKEIKDIGLKIENGNYTWNKDKEKPLVINFTDQELDLLIDRVNSLDKENKISLNLVDICLKIKDEKENAKKDK